MKLTSTFNVGRFRCHQLEAGLQHLDGGAMFGVVPKPLWEKRIPPDQKNRIPLAMRCLLVEHDAGPILIDTGMGNKENEKFLQIYGVENTGTSGPTQLEDALKEVGFAPVDIRYVINTHLHFDHAGGNTFVEVEDTGGEPGSVEWGTGRLADSPTRRLAVSPSGRPIRLSFPNATYVVQRGEVDYATHTNERTAVSYLPPNFQPITEAGRWRLVEGEVELLPGIRLLPTPGHVPHHQSVMIHDGPEIACFLADLVPTTSHLPLPWIMGYDVEPLVTLETKRRILTRAHRENWTLLFEHDPVHGIGRLEYDGKTFIYQRLDTP